MSLPKQLEDALNGAPKYNPSMMDNARAPKLDLNRARRRMLDGEGPEDGEEGGGGRVSDKVRLKRRLVRRDSKSIIPLSNITNKPSAALARV